MLKKMKLLNFTELYRCGKPFETDAVVANYEDNYFFDSDDLKYFDITFKNDTIILQYNLEKNDIVYGLGEALGGVNKRGRKYRLFANDDPLHTPEKEALYGSHPFLIVKGKETFGLFIDFPGEILLDIGFTDIDIMTITITKKDVDIYIFSDKNILSIIKEFLTLTGTPYIPPKWAFGFGQSRWSYPDEKTISEIANNFRKNEIPCDMIFIDIDYMDNYKVFTVNQNNFPNFASFVKNMKKNGFKLLPIIDPGVKIEKGYPVYEEGLQNDYFCKDHNGNNFVGAVWPGLTHFPDFLNKKSRDWWGALYKKLTDLGIEGFWNDMNEMAIFYTKDGLNDLKKSYEEILSKDDPGFDFFKIKDKANGLSNRLEDYKRIIHKSDNGNSYTNEELHNLYGYNMTRATAEGLYKINPNLRYFILTRSSYIGLHRFAAIWMGDNQSWWEHMLVNIKMLISLNICGFFYTGADIGGFGNNASPELVVRWMQLGVFNPLYRNHSALGTRAQEPWAFGGEVKDIIRDTVRFRYALIPYIYSEFMKSIIELMPFIKPLSFVYEDKISQNIEDQFLFGNSIMVAPIYEPNKRGRFVYLPESNWLLWNVSKYDKTNLKICPKGTHFIESKISEIPIFIKENSLVVLTEPQNYVGERAITKLKVIGFVTDRASFVYYEDDGITHNYKDGKFSSIKIFVEKIENDYDIYFDVNENSEVKFGIKEMQFEIYNESGRVFIEKVIG